MTAEVKKKQMSTSNLFDIQPFEETITYLQSLLPEQLKSPLVGVICGSGLGKLAESLTEPIVKFDYKDIPHFAISTVQGHAGQLVFGFMAGKPTVVMVGRKHFYEGHQLQKTVFPVRIMKLLGVEILIVTNAAGGLNEDFAVGDIMVIQDHISLAVMSGINPLIGPNISEFGPRFPPTSNCYDQALQLLAFKSASKIELPMSQIHEGTYTFVTGPSFETRSEARFLRSIGADCVGMSTVPEVLVASHCGMRVLGLSLITNKAHSESVKAIFLGGGAVKGLGLEGANHEEVLETGRLKAAVMQNLVKTIIQDL